MLENVSWPFSVALKYDGKKMGSKVLKITMIDCEKNPEAAKTAGVEGYPTFILNDLIWGFFPNDICGETSGIKMPRHAKSWGNGQEIKNKLSKERSKAIKGFKDDVSAGKFPNSDHTVEMFPGEKDVLLERLDSF